MKKSIFVFIIISLFVFILLIIFPQTSMEAAKSGLELWFNIVLPSLLPFFIGSYILLETQVLNVLSFIFAPVTKFLFGCSGHSSYVFVASAFSGYPMGAKLTANLYENKMITQSEAQRMVNLSSVTGPVFIYGSIAAGLLGSPEVGIYIALPHYLSAIFATLLFRIFSKNKIDLIEAKKSSLKKEINNLIFKNKLFNTNIGSILSKAVLNSVNTLLLLLGFIMFFSVIISLFDKIKIVDFYTFLYSPILRVSGLPDAASKAFFSGFIEMTAGVYTASSLDVDVITKAIICSGIVSYGGLCIQAQTYSICAKSKFKPKGFMFSKTLQASLSSLMTYLMFKFFPISIKTSTISKGINISENYIYAGSIFLIICLVLYFYLRFNKRAKSF